MRLKVAVLLNISILISFSKQNDTTTNNNSVIVTNSDVKNINFYVGDTNNSADNEYIIKRNKIETRASCTPNVTLLDCNTKNESHEKWNWHQEHKFIIKSITESNCPQSTLTFQWTTKSKNREAEPKQYPEFKNKQAFILYPFSLKIGNYTLELNVTEIAPDKEIGTQLVKCNIRFIPEEPFPMILGGRSRTLPSDALFYVLAQEVDYERHGYLNKTLYWKCRATPVNRFCLYYKFEDDFIKVPAEYAIDGTNYSFVFTVKTEYSDAVTVTQEVQIRKNAVELEITCISNCDKRHCSTYYPINLQLYWATVNMGLDSYHWTIRLLGNKEEADVKFLTQTAFSQFNYKLYITDLPRQNNLYNFTVETKDGRPGSGSFILERQDPAENRVSCNCKPSLGNTTSFFVIQCSVPENEYIVMRLFQSLKETKNGVLLSITMSNKFEVLLAAGTKEENYLTKIHVQFDYQSDIEIEVTVN